MSDRCDKCRFYAGPRVDRKENIGSCRVSSANDATFPPRYVDDWCGEFKAAGCDRTPACTGIVTANDLTAHIATIRFDDWIPKKGSRIEMRVVKGPDGGCDE